MGLGGDTWVSDTNTASYCLRTTDSLMAISSCMNHRPQHGLMWLTHGTHISMAPRIRKVHRNHQGIRQRLRHVTVSTRNSNFIASWGKQQHGPQTQAWYPVVSQTMVVFRGGLIQNVNLSSSQTSSLPRVRGIPLPRDRKACTFIMC